ncbi:MAG: WD40 repeat domain-containing protein [Microcystis sp. M53603_WE2]|jgi:WD40 repeat protein|uniref:WD40 repeat domain-containing protein n=1 Tax=unclassified Microcystis TaxID=2643300 RepID=UPI00258D6AF3|nr:MULTISPECIES: WD40 repeat domain-containing protein [unclassified Microcystis]MDJ0526279.1 WD40 repeat domain-containing protein [Microcystis sp. M53600_WE12]MDJ0540915.1 WD40 repeat domain-containing protein [Microcystis sp. M53603_WE2]MDJ0603542.1 WD40 repeat domain-containing protein [Microcystis sp. M53602_WE12]
MDKKERQLYLATVPSSAFESGNLRRYYGCLTCYPFISDKLNHPSFDVQDVINDYDYVHQSDLRNHPDYDAERTEAIKLIQEMFRLSAHILMEHPDQLIPQLLGRLSYPSLLENFYIQSFLEQAKAKIVPPALIPYLGSLQPPGTGLIRTLLVSPFEVNSIAITSDGAKIISAASGTVKVWDIATGQESLTLTNPNSLVDRVAVSQDGTKIVGSFYTDGIVKVWDVKTGRELLGLNVDSYCVHGVALTPDGTKIVTGGWDQNVKVWDIKNGKKLLTLTGHKTWVEFVAVTADGTKIISADSDSTIKVWDIQTGRKIRTLIDCWSVKGIAVTSDGAKIVAACGDETIKVWHIDIKIWNVLAESLFSKFNARNNELSGVIKTPDQAKIAPILGNKTGKLWDITKKVWDMVIGRPSLTLTGGHKWSPSAVTLTPDAAKIVSGGLDETIRIWDLRTGEQLGCLRGHNQLVNDLAVTPDGTKIVSASNDGTVKIWDTEKRYEIRNSMRYVGVTPDGTRFVLADWDGMIKIWDMETNRELYAFTAPIDRVNMRDSTPDRTKIISVSSDEIGDTKPFNITNNIVIWNIETGHALLTITGHNSVFNDVAVTPDGEKIVSASRDGMVKVWDIETGQVSLTLAGHNDAVTSVKVTPDGKKIVSSGWDRTVKVWDIETGQASLTLAGHNSVVSNVAVTPDGKKIVSSGWDRTVKVWDIETGECLTTFVGESRFGQVIISFDGKKIFAKEFNLNRDGVFHFLELIV